MDSKDDPGNQPALPGARLPGPETVPEAWSRPLTYCVPRAVGLARDRLKHTPSEATIAQYEQILQRLNRRGTGLESAPSQIGHDRIRAALTYVAACAVLEAVTPDHAALGPETDENEFRQCLAVLLAYPPKDFLGHHTGTAVQPRPRARSPGEAGARARRKHAGRVARSRRFRRGDFWLNGPTDPELATALAVVFATGARPVELADGVRLRVADATLLEIMVPGAKNTQYAGYDWRALVFPVGAPETVYLDDRTRAAGGRLYIDCPEDTLRAVVQETARRTFDRRLAEDLTAYTLRHLAAGRFRQLLDGETAARALGHRSPATTREYSKAWSPGPVPERVRTPDTEATGVAEPPVA